MGLSETLAELHAHPSVGSYEFDERLLLSILLALAAGERSLLLRVGAEGERLARAEQCECVTRLAHEVAWILQTIFALSTHRVPCSPKTTSLNFLRSLFIPTAPAPFKRTDSGGPAPSASTSAGPRRPRRSLSLPLSSLVPAALDLRAEDRRGKGQIIVQPSPTRRNTNTSDSMQVGPSSPFFAEPVSFVRDPDDSSAGEDLYPHRPSPERRKSSARRSTIGTRGKEPLSAMSGAPPNGTPPLASGVRDGSTNTLSGYFASARNSPAVSKISSARSPNPRAPFHANGDRRTSNTTRSTSPAVPRIIRSPTVPIFSTADPFNPHASPVLLRTQSPNRNGFAASPRLTPPVQPSLASNRRNSSDRTASSPSLNPTPRLLPQVLILERLERARPSVQQALLDVLRERRVIIPSKRVADDAASVRTRRTSDWAIGRDDSDKGWDGSFNLPKGFFVVAIVCDDPDDLGPNGSWGGVSRHLFDHFSLSQSLPSHTFYSPSSPPYAAPTAPAVHPLSPSSPALLSSAPIPTSTLDALHLSDALTTYAADLLSTLRHHPLLDARMLTSRCSTELEKFVRVWVHLSRCSSSSPSSSTGGEPEPIIIVGPKDVLAVVMGVVAHRILLRDPSEEKSLFWGSELECLVRNELRRDGVEGVVRRVMGEV